MKNIERGSIKHLIILIIAIAVCGMILYPIYDLIFYKFITNSEFVYSFHSYIIRPLLFSLVLGTTLWVIEKKQK
ncbi:MAG: hypothetical protein IJ220_03970 [Clostridia bacterium]|nr:hypothetical protein [Clostridia bacterium]